MWSWIVFILIGWIVVAFSLRKLGIVGHDPITKLKIKTLNEGVKVPGTRLRYIPSKYSIQVLKVGKELILPTGNWYYTIHDSEPYEYEGKKFTGYGVLLYSKEEEGLAQKLDSAKHISLKCDYNGAAHQFIRISISGNKEYRDCDFSQLDGRRIYIDDIQEIASYHDRNFLIEVID